MTDWKPIETAPRNDPFEDYGPRVILRVGEQEAEGYYCGGLELGEIWIPPGWYDDDGLAIDPVPTQWKPKQDPTP